MSENVWDDLVGGAKQDSESFEKRNDKDDKEFTPMVFLRAGSHKLRLYPDKRNPSRIRLIRRISFHRATVPMEWKDKEGKITTKERSARVRCEGDATNCRVCKVMDEAKGLGYENAWKHWNSTGLAYAVIFESTEKSDFVKLNTPVVVALEGKMIYAINKLISGYTGQEVQSIIDTLEDSNIMEIDHKPGAGGNTMARLDPIRRKPLPPIPDYFDDLDNMFVKNEPGSDEEVKLICQAIMANVGANAAKNLVEPNAPTTQQSKPAESTPASYTPPLHPATPGSFPGIPNIIANLAGTYKIPDKSPACYGARPESGHPICTACSFEPTCAQVTISEKLSVKR